jgi:hypothetical protein
MRSRWALLAAFLCFAATQLAADRVLEVAPEDAAALVEKADKVAVDRNVIFFVGDDLTPGGAAELSLKSLQKANVSSVLIGLYGGAPSAEFPFASHVVLLTQPPQCAQPERRRTVGCWRLFLMAVLLRHEFHVFLADFDVLFLFNPFPYMDVRMDVHVMSDASNLAQLAYMDLPSGGTAFGTILDATKKVPFLWSQQVAIFNIGTMYVRATRESQEAFRIVRGWLTNTSLWDQQVVSLQLLSLSLQGALSLKVWDPRLVMNSGFWANFKEQLRHPPIAFHPSAHGDKVAAMKEFAASSFPATEPFRGLHMVDFSGPYGVQL